MSDIKFEDYKKLISQEAWKGLKKLNKFGIYTMEYEDVYQEMCVFFHIALKAFDPSKGFAFSTYLVSVCRRRFQHLYLDLVAERQNICAVEDIESGQDDDFSLYDVVATDEPLIEDKVANNAESMAKIQSLSVEAKGVVMELIDPSKELREYFQAVNAHVMMGRENKVKTGRLEVDIGIKTICDYYAINARGRRLVRDELSKTFGVEL